MVTAQAALTPKAERAGAVVRICRPDWFDAAQTWAVNRPLPDAAALTFPGEDLNFLARALYAEASGRGAVTDEATRSREKRAILHVCYFRLLRRGYPNNAYVARSFTDVLKAPGQFESVFAANRKLDHSRAAVAEGLPAGDCADLCEALAAVRQFLAAGPDYRAFPYDRFLAAAGRKGWTVIGGNEFNLFPAHAARMREVAS